MLKKDMKKLSVFIQFLICLTFAILFSGCETLNYYGQAITGQIKIMNSRQPIDRVIADPKTPDTLKTRLRQVLKIRDFAKKRLFLPVEDNYLTYTDLKRPYAVWAVYAAPEFSLEPKTWNYPFIGKSAYRGYFSESDANKYANELVNEGFDVYVGGVSAYSTLGWFDDSVFSTVIDRSEAGIAALIFHELSHQLIYVKGDSTFNESFATAVEQEGLRRWMISINKKNDYDYYIKSNKRHKEFIQLIIKYRQKLDTLYQKELELDHKRLKKRLIFKELKKEYELIKKDWGGYAGYDDWFSNQLNNAKLVTVAVYYDFVPALLMILEKNNGDIKLFYKKCNDLAQKNRIERHRELQRLKPEMEQKE